MTLLADRAAEEDIKEEMLLYSILAKERVNVRDLRQVDAAIEEYLKTTFNIEVNFDVDDAFKRLTEMASSRSYRTGRSNACRPKKPPCTSTSSGMPASTTCLTSSSRRGGRSRAAAIARLCADGGCAAERALG
jgi:hypothetical protein